MKEIKLKICAGTMCYVMGGAQLLEITDLLSEEEKEHVDITFSHCLKQCNGQEKPPFAELNGQIIAGASRDNLLRIIKEEIKHAVR